MKIRPQTEIDNFAFKNSNIIIKVIIQMIQYSVLFINLANFFFICSKIEIYQTIQQDLS